MPRDVLVDNTDSKIRYSSGWNAEDGSKWASQGNFGAPFLNTLHSTSAASASFDFDFDGKFPSSLFASLSRRIFLHRFCGQGYNDQQRQNFGRHPRSHLGVQD